MKTDKRLIERVSLCMTVMVAILMGSATAMAQAGYPQPTDPLINDYAGLLTPHDAAGVRNLFTDLKRDAGVEAMVVTINSIRDYDTGDETIESFATNLFNTWGIGDEERNDGVLILVAVKDREVRIEIGAGYGDIQNANMQEVINEHMLPHFKEENYSRGIYLGARAVVGKLTGTWPEDLSQGASGTGRVTSPESDAPSSAAESIPAWNPLNYYGLLPLLGAVAWFVFDRRRTRVGYYSKLRRNVAVGGLIAAIVGVLLCAFAWLGADRHTAIRLSNCLLFGSVSLGALGGLLQFYSRGGHYSRYESRRHSDSGFSGSHYDKRPSSSRSSSRGGRSSGGGASGKW